jgi:hypothetical protein
LRRTTPIDDQILRRQGDRLDPLDGESRSEVAQRDGILVIDAGGEAGAEDAPGHVPGAGDVAHPASPRREGFFRLFLLQSFL